MDEYDLIRSNRSAKAYQEGCLVLVVITTVGGLGHSKGGTLTPSERSVTRSSIAKLLAFSLSFNLWWFLGQFIALLLMSALEGTHHFVKVFCCTLIHCFSTVNIVDQEGIQGRQVLEI